MDYLTWVSGWRKMIHIFGKYAETKCERLCDFLAMLLIHFLFLFSYFNAEEGKFVTKRFAGMERVYVDGVKLKGNDTGTMEKSSVVITMRVPVGNLVFG